MRLSVSCRDEHAIEQLPDEARRLDVTAGSTTTPERKSPEPNPGNKILMRGGRHAKASSATRRRIDCAREGGNAIVPGPRAPVPVWEKSAFGTPDCRPKSGNEV
jgi:hypothetical protein